MKREKISNEGFFPSSLKSPWKAGPRKLRVMNFTRTCKVRSQRKTFSNPNLDVALSLVSALEKMQTIPIFLVSRRHSICSAPKAQVPYSYLCMGEGPEGGGARGLTPVPPKLHRNCKSTLIWHCLISKGDPPPASRQFFIIPRPERAHPRMPSVFLPRYPSHLTPPRIKKAGRWHTKGSDNRRQYIILLGLCTELC